MTRPNPRIRRATIEGEPVVQIELASRRMPGIFATMDEADYEAWVAEGRSILWYYGSNGVTTFRVIYTRRDVAGFKSGVARDLLDCPPGRVVRYADGNPLNLRRSNLFVENGMAKGQRLLPQDDFAVAA